MVCRAGGKVMARRLPQSFPLRGVRGRASGTLRASSFGTRFMQDVDDLHSVSSRFYRAALRRLLEAEIPFLVGGAYALEAHTRIIRRTKDFIDIIFNSGNGICRVDETWFDFAIDGRVLGLDLKLCPAEETIWQKSFILERDRCDVADVAHLLRHVGRRLDWQRLIRRFDRRWRVLLAQVVLFDFVYPDHRDSIPKWVRKELIKRFRDDKPDEAQGSDDPICHGTLLSATQYLRDVDLEGYRDARLEPIWGMSKDEIAVWTANFMKPK
jgi:hypothetical protein